ncbi:MAG: hypothetical protein LBM75_07210 [Myxococcales bacterium]|jgi:hypothetical protein|nr:hypothetical protein [Myxococcales bacterium]
MITFDSEFEKLGNMFLAAVRAQSGVVSVEGPEGRIELPKFNSEQTDLEGTLSIDDGMVALQKVRQVAPETVRTLEPQFRQLIEQAEAGQGIESSDIQGYITSGSALLGTVFSGVTALVNAKNTTTTNANTTNVGSNVNVQQSTRSSSLNMSFAVGGLALFGLLAFAYFKQ